MTTPDRAKPGLTTAAEAQGQFARAWFGRVTSQWFAIGIRVFRAQFAAMAPIREAVVANAERLVPWAT